MAKKEEDGATLDDAIHNDTAAAVGDVENVLPFPKRDQFAKDLDNLAAKVEGFAAQLDEDADRAAEIQDEIREARDEIHASEESARNRRKGGAVKVAAVGFGILAVAAGIAIIMKNATKTVAAFF